MFSGEISLKLFIKLSGKAGMDILRFDGRLLRIAGKNIVDSLMCIINNSILNGTFLDDWKLVRVIPVYKNNTDANNMSNYRSVSITGHIAKLMEQLGRSQLVSYLEQHVLFQRNGVHTLNSLYTD